MKAGVKPRTQEVKALEKTGFELFVSSRKAAVAIFVFLVCSSGYSQTRLDLRTQTKNVDFSGALTTKPVKVGTAIPAVCSAGELYFKSDAPAGSNLFGCTSTDTWTVLSAGTTSSGSPAGPFYCDAAGVNTYSCSGISALTSYAAGQLILFKPSSANTGAATLNINLLGAKPIRRNSTDAVPAGDLTAGQVVSLVYDGTAFQLQSPSSVSRLLTAKGDVVGFDGSAAVRVPGCPDGQVQIGDATQSTGWRCASMSGGGASLPSGTTLPGTCAAGSLFLKTDANPPLYQCVAANIWRQSLSADIGYGLSLNAGTLAIAAPVATTDGDNAFTGDNRASIKCMANATGVAANRFVKMASDGCQVVTSANDEVIGVAVAAAANGPATVITGGRVLIDSDSAVSVGDYLTLTADGRVHPAGKTRTAAGRIVAIAQDSGATPRLALIRLDSNRGRVRMIPFSFGDGGTVITGGTAYVTVGFACAISAWSITADGGTATFKVWRAASGTAAPTSANSLNTNGVSLATGTHVRSTNVSDFSATSIAANDVLAASIASVSGAKALTLTLECDEL